MNCALHAMQTTEKLPLKRHSDKKYKKKNSVFCMVGQQQRNSKYFEWHKITQTEKVYKK